jgi:predicted metal-dependent peptidase
MTTEQVYDLLIQEAKQNPNSPLNSPDGFPGIGEDLEDGSASGMDEEELSERIQQTLVRAAIRSKEAEDKPGTIPGDIQLFLDKLLKPKLPWNRILQKYLSQYTKSDYTFRKPNRRFFPDHYLPSLYSVTLIDMAVAVDISGSVSDTDFKRFVSEIASIFRMVKPKKISLIQFDTEIKSVDEIHNFRDLMNVEFRGRGGTDIGEVIKWINAHKPQLLLVFTDGEFNFYDHKTKQDVLWVIHNNKQFKPNFGKAIHYDVD